MTSGVSGGSGFAASQVNPAIQYDVYGAIFTFAKIGFYVMGLIDKLGPGDVLAEDNPPMLRFWPPINRTLHWPPADPPLDRTTRQIFGRAPIDRAPS